jgi:hypothetical protein
LTYTLSGPVGAGISSNGVITWTPGVSDVPGTNVFVTVASDGSLSATNQFTVIVAPEPIINPTIIEAVAVTNGVVALRWNTVLGHTYQLQFTTNLTTAAWVDVPPDVIATGSTLTVTNAVGPAPYRFFRVFIVR